MTRSKVMEQIVGNYYVTKGALLNHSCDHNLSHMILDPIGSFLYNELTHLDISDCHRAPRQTFSDKLIICDHNTHIILYKISYT